MQVLIINGPNLNLLGSREPEIYGTQTLDDINRNLSNIAAQLGLKLASFQSNNEGELINRIHTARGQADYIIINAGAYTHTSIALRDALAGVAIPFVEVHLSNVHARESFRQHSYLSDKAVGVIVGLGSFGYEAALQFIARQSGSSRSSIN